MGKLTGKSLIGNGEFVATRFLAKYPIGLVSRSSRWMVNFIMPYSGVREETL